MSVAIHYDENGVGTLVHIHRPRAALDTRAGAGGRQASSKARGLVSAPISHADIGLTGGHLESLVPNSDAPTTPWLVMEPEEQEDELDSMEVADILMDENEDEDEFELSLSTCGNSSELGDTFDNSHTDEDEDEDEDVDMDAGNCSSDSEFGSDEEDEEKEEEEEDLDEDSHEQQEESISARLGNYYASDDDSMTETEHETATGSESEWLGPRDEALDHHSYFTLGQADSFVSRHGGVSSEMETLSESTSDSDASWYIEL